MSRASILFHWASQGPGLGVRAATNRRRIVHSRDQRSNLWFGRPIFHTSARSSEAAWLQIQPSRIVKELKSSRGPSFALQAIDPDCLTSMLALICAGTARLVDALNKFTRGFGFIRPGLMA